MSKLETYFRKISGKAIYPEHEAFIRKFEELPDGFYTHRIESAGRIRSIKQNNSMWGIPYVFFKKALQESGNYVNISDQQVHEFCMHHCLPEDYKERIRNEWKESTGMIDIRTGEMFKSAFRLTTTKMTTVDAMNYYTNMQQFYTEWFSSGKYDDYIPDPDPKYKKKRK